MDFMIFDLAFLVLFLLGVSFFLYSKRKKIKKEGLLFLYHAKWGVKLIEKTGKKYPKTLEVLSHFSVWIGYILMTVMMYLFIRILWIYAFHGDIVRAIKIPPIMPLIPYLPQIFKLSFLPPFFFSYWIIILAVIAISHEFFHGIFAAKANVKTRTTGFGFFPFFFPVFLAAFVNLDEKAMAKIKNFEQRAVLSAGTFANILTALLGILLMWGFFVVAYSPAGIIYDDYAYDIVDINNITSINGIPFELMQGESREFVNPKTFGEITVNGQEYIALKGQVGDKVLLYFDAPAINNNLTGAISEINGIKINGLETLSLELEKYSPEEKITLQIYNGEDYHNQDIILGTNPETGKAWIGITFLDKTSGSFLTKLTSITTAYKDPNIHYEPKWAFAKFIYDLLWWLVLISFSVALVNMLPMGIFDGGRFFYLTVLAITKSERKAEKSFKVITNFLLALLFIIMFFWAKSFF